MVLLSRSVLSTCVLILSSPVSSRELIAWNLFSLTFWIDSFFLVPISHSRIHSGLPYFEKGLHMKPPPNPPHLFKLLSCFPPPFPAKYYVHPCLYDSFSHHSSAIWLSHPTPTLTWLCLWSSTSKFKGFFLISVLFGLLAVVSIADCHLLRGILSPPGLGAHPLCCCFSFPVASSSNALTAPFSFFPLLGCGRAGRFTVQPLDLSLYSHSLIPSWSPALPLFLQVWPVLLHCVHLFSILSCVSCLLSFCFGHAGLLVVSWRCCGQSDTGFLLLVLFNLHSSPFFLSF